VEREKKNSPDVAGAGKDRARLRSRAGPVGRKAAGSGEPIAGCAAGLANNGSSLRPAECDLIPRRHCTACESYCANSKQRLVYVNLTTHEGGASRNGDVGRVDNALFR
jgi:hypothetical protein